MKDRAFEGMESISVSAIIVCKDNPEELRHTLGSIRHEDRAVCDVVIVDGSTEGSGCEQVARSMGFAESHRREVDTGIFNAMNKGIARAVGECAIFMNSGDILHPEFSLSAFLQRHREVLKKHVVVGQPVFRLGERRFRNLARRDPIHQAVFFPIESLREHRYDESLLIAADTELILRLAAEWGKVDVSEVICEFQLGGISTAPPTYAHIRAMERDRRARGGLSTFRERVFYRARLIARMVLSKLLGYERYFLWHATLSRKWEEVR